MEELNNLLFVKRECLESIKDIQYRAGSITCQLKLSSILDDIEADVAKNLYALKSLLPITQQLDEEYKRLKELKREIKNIQDDQ